MFIQVTELENVNMRKKHKDHISWTKTLISHQGKMRPEKKGDVPKVTQL